LTASTSSSDPDPDDPLLHAYLVKRRNLVLYLASRTGSLARAEDLAQDLYLKIAGRDRTVEVRAPGALLYRMAANLMVDDARSRRRAAGRDGAWRVEGRTDLGGEEISDEPPADEVIIARERVRQLAEAVAGLPPQMGRAFRLHKLEGLSQAQTAQAMGVSVKAIEQHLRAAMLALTRRLQP
jgi:RNA polymerase sigma-70 factor (ECF subfamily)